MDSSRVLRPAALGAGAVGVFVVCSIIQAAGGSSMFSQDYYPPDSVLLDFAMNMTFWPGWLLTGALLLAAGGALRDSGIFTEGARDEPTPSATAPALASTPHRFCGQCGTQATGRFCGQCGHEHPVQPGSAVQAPPEEPGPQRQLLGALLLLGATTLVIAVALATWFGVRGSSYDEDEAYWSATADGGYTEYEPDPQAVPADTSTTTVTSPPEDDEEGLEDDDETCSSSTALDVLEGRRDATLEHLDMDGRWVLQLDSKYDGVVDPLSTPPSGGQAFTLSDICEVQGDKATQWEQAAGILHLRATDFGRSSGGEEAEETWVLLIDPGPDSLAPMGNGKVTAEQAKSACGTFFPDLTGEELANECVPRRLTPPGEE